MAGRRLLVPPFTLATALQKVRAAENAWNSQDAVAVSLGYSADSRWRNREEFLEGREEIVAFLKRKWEKELNYSLVKELWAFGDARIAVRFAYEWHDTSGQWFRSYGNENWEFNDDGLMRYRHASVNDVAITERNRKLLWEPSQARPQAHAGLSQLGL